jgi:septum formation protein
VVTGASDALTPSGLLERERLVLASKSAARRAMLENAGVTFEVRVAGVDEEAIKAASGDLDAAALAVRLAEAKALAVSRDDETAWVLGSDQTLAFDGGLVSKAGSLQTARERLRAMRGRTHQLHSGAALAVKGEIVWSGVDTVEMRMREFSDAFLDAYLAAEGEALLSCVGAYRLEGVGSQLFEAVDGDYFTVLGLPLWPVLAELRRAGVIAS